MFVNPEEIPIYHITAVANLQGILAEGGLHSDAVMAQRHPDVVIGYDHIKRRRLEELTVGCCGNRFVGEFVPFYLCPRSPMLLAVNTGKTGRSPGSQRTIVHLQSTLAKGIATGRPWAVSSGNAGAYHTTFDDQLMAVAMLDWDAIHAASWAGRQHQKSAEFLLAEFFPWAAFDAIGCQNSAVAHQVAGILAGVEHRPAVSVQPSWYYS